MVFRYTEGTTPKIDLFLILCMASRTRKELEFKFVTLWLSLYYELQQFQLVENSSTLTWKTCQLIIDISVSIWGDY